MKPIITPRLHLRNLSASDAPVIAEHMADWDVVRMLARPPWPYTLADAESWLIKAQTYPWEFAITRDDTLIGVVGITGHLGYWLARTHWGQGYMTEAARGLLTAYFRKKRDPLVSGVFVDNPASHGVLIKLGFTETGRSWQFCRPRGENVDHVDMTLTRDTWIERAA